MPNTVIIPRLQAELDMAQAALGAAQYERANYSGDDPHTLATLDLRVAQARATLDAATTALDAAATALAESQADLAIAETR